MRKIWIALIPLVVAGISNSTQAKELATQDQYMCSWGAGTAARAQELKLSGVSLYAARQKIQTPRVAKSVGDDFGLKRHALSYRRG